MPIVTPFNPSAAPQPGITDLGSTTEPYRAEFLTEKVQISSVDPSPVDTDIGITAAHFVGTNSGGAFSGGAILSAFGGNIPSLFAVLSPSPSDLDPTFAAAGVTDQVFLLAPYASDGSNFIGTVGTLNVIVDAAPSAGEVPVKLGFNNGAGVYSYKGDFYFGSDRILLLNSNTDAPKAASRQFTNFSSTSNATPLVMDTFPLEDETVYEFRSEVKGRFRNTGSNKGVAGFLEFMVYRNNAGSATLVSTPFKGLTDLGTSGYDFNATVSGNNVQIEVTGATGEVVDWTTDTVWSGAGS